MMIVFIPCIYMTVYERAYIYNVAARCKKVAYITNIEYLNTKN